MVVSVTGPARGGDGGGSRRGADPGSGTRVPFGAMDYVPLLFLGLAVVGGAIVLRSMIRLKRAAVGALEAARQLDDQLESLRTRTQAADEVPPQDQPPPG